MAAAKKAEVAVDANPAQTQEPTETIVAYKGFDRNMQCRGYQFAIGQTYEHDGKVEACASGFHACEHPLDVLDYYAPSESRYAVVEQRGDLSRHGEDTKVASRLITIKSEIDIAGLVRAAIEWTTKRCLPIDPASPASAAGYQGAASATGDRGVASATGYQGAASATGDRGVASATGDRGAASAAGDQGAASAAGDRGVASATGDRGVASATGYQGAASATGEQGAASATGDHGVASATGHSGVASATGYQGAASASGYRGVASATGYQGVASATGEQGAASATGDRGAASATGDRGAASATGHRGVAVACGAFGRAMAAASGAIVLSARNADGSIRYIRASKVGDNGIEPDVWYSLNEAGEFVAVPQ